MTGYDLNPDNIERITMSRSGIQVARSRPLGNAPKY
jgi:hypothetical protein